MATYQILIILWVFLLISLFFCAVFFFILQTRAKTDKIRQKIMRLFFLLFLFFGISRTFHLITYILYGGTSTPYEIKVEYELIFTLSQIFIFSAIIIMITYFEKRIERLSKHYFTILLIIATIVYFIFRHIHIFDSKNEFLILLDNTTSYIVNGIIGVFWIILSLMYLKVSFSTTGKVRRKSLFVFIGFMLLICSYGIFLLDIVINPEIDLFISMILTYGAIPFIIFGYY